MDEALVPSQRLPLTVWFARAAAPGPLVSNVVDGVTLQDGDRVLRLDATTGEPEALCQWSTASAAFTDTPLEPDRQLLVTEPGGTANGGKVWWREAGTLLPYRVASRYRHTAGITRTKDVDFTAEALVLNQRTPHVFVLLVRATNGLYAPVPDQATCNLYTYPAWMFPVQTADGTDRLNLAGLCAGLIVFSLLALFFFVPAKTNKMAHQQKKKGKQRRGTSAKKAAPKKYTKPKSKAAKPKKAKKHAKGALTPARRHLSGSRYPMYAGFPPL